MFTFDGPRITYKVVQAARLHLSPLLHKGSFAKIETVSPRKKFLKIEFSRPFDLNDMLPINIKQQPLEIG